MTPIAAPRDFRVIAHRGASGYAPENTIAAFRMADDMKVDDIEFDLQLTRDSKAVLVHDPELGRYGHPGCHVGEMTLAELKVLDMGAWFGDGEYSGERIITLSELLAAYSGRFFFHAEIKAPSRELAALLAAALDEFAIADRTVVTSFDFDILVTFRALAPRQPVGWLVRTGGFTEDNIERAVAAGFSQFCPRADEVTREKVSAARARVPSIRAHGIKSPEDARRAVEAGCDGMTINWPDWVRAA